MSSSSRPGRRRTIIALALGGALLVGVGGYFPLTLLADSPAVAATPSAREPLQQQPVALSQNVLGSGGLSVLGVPPVPGAEALDGMFLTHGTEGPHPIASITKIITALVILDAKPIGVEDGVVQPGPTIAFTSADVALYDKYYVLGATIESMPRGSRLSQRDALEVMLVVSASNYAEALSTWAFGSPAGYRAAAAEWLAKNGLSGTTIVDPTGLNPDNTSTVSDLIALGKLALANPVVAEIVRTPVLSVPGLSGRPNNNPLLGGSGVTGIKTGTLPAAGSCVLFSAEFTVGGETVTVVGVVLGTSSGSTAAQIARDMISSVANGFTLVTLAAKGDEFGRYQTPWGATATAVAGEAASILVWADAPIAETVSLRPLSPTTEGEAVGEVRYTVGKQTITVPLVLREALDGPDDWWRITHPAEMLGG